MKVNSNRDISFKSLYTSKTLKKGLEFASDNGLMFQASTVVAFSALRPMAIWMTPNTDKENRKIASAKSVTSSILGFLLTLCASLPLASGIKKIDKNPEKYLNQKTINALKDTGKDLTSSKGYIFATQLFKLGLGSIIAVPKAVMTAESMPYVANIFNKKNDTKDSSKFKQVNFKANPIDKIAKTTGNLINKKGMQKFTDKYKDSNFPLHIIALTDALSTLTFVHQTKKSKKIKEERKNALIYNSLFATGMSILSGYFLDTLLEKPTQKFIEKNKGSKNLEKQIQGIKIIKPMLILGGVYYLLIPFLSTFLAEQVDKSK